MMHAVLRPVAIASALCASSVGFAEPGPERAGKLTDLRVERGPAPSATPRDDQPYPSGSLVSVRDELENFPVDTSLASPGVSALPTSFTGPPGFEWPLNTIRGQPNIDFVRLIDLAGAPVGGPNGVVNSSKVIRIFTAAAQPAGGFFFGANLRFGGSPGEQTLPLQPIPGHNARISAEHYLSSIDSLYTFEPVAVFTGFITGRLLWGGTCIDPVECNDLGLPIGPILHFHTFNPFVSFGVFSPTYYCEDAQGFPIPDCVPHPGFDIGDPVPPPVQNWFRLAAETSADGRLRYYLDLLDGTQEAAFFESFFAFGSTSLIDMLAWNASFEAQGEFMLVDNIEASGPLYQLPKPPALACPYADDIEWLNTGPVLGQTSRWFAALTSALSVVDDGAGNRFLRQVNNVRSDNRFREEFRTTLPNAYALPGDPWTLCVDAATTLNGMGNAAARAFSIDAETNNFIPGGVTTRVYLGITDPDTGLADSTIYVQVNPEYNPIDDPGVFDPLQYSIPVVGVDVVSTGVQWAADGQFRTLCVTVGNDNAMTVSLEGVEIYSGFAFSNAAARFAAESENNAFGSDARLDVDNVEFACDPLPVVALPDLAAPYTDGFAWGVDNIPPRRHIDDPGASPLESTRYTNAAGVVMLDGGVAMRNVDRDSQPAVPNPNVPPIQNGQNYSLYTQFTTRTPSVLVDDQTGWRVEMTLTMSDFLTSRGFAPAQLSDVGGSFELVGYLWIPAANQRVYLFAHPENAGPDDDLIVIDTGFTLDALGVTPGAPFAAGAEYNRMTGMIDWSMNGAALGSTFPIVGTDDLGDPRVHRNLDGVFLFGGRDDTAPAAPPLSTLSLEELRVFRTGPCADANGDGVVNFADLNATLASFGATGVGLPADFNGDGVVNFEDLNLVLGGFGEACD